MNPPATLRPVVAEDPGHGGLQMLITAGPARFVADEPVAMGGFDLGPTPHDLASAALAACTAQTLRLYAGRKGWPLGPVRVAVTHSRDAAASPPDRFARLITLSGALDEAQRARLLQIAEHCPVHRMLAAGADVSTALTEDGGAQP